MDGGTAIFSDPARGFQGPTAPLPLRSRGLVLIDTDPAGLDRLADHALQFGRHAEAERLAFLAAELRLEVA